MPDYQESVTTRQTGRQTDEWTDGQTDRQTPDKVIPLCHYASQATQQTKPKPTFLVIGGRYQTSVTRAQLVRISRIWLIISLYYNSPSLSLAVDTKPWLPEPNWSGSLEYG